MKVAPRRLLRLGLLLCGLAVLPYLNALDAGFTLDDAPQIRENPAVTGGVDVIQILASPLFPGDLYRPFTTLTFAVNQAVTPGQPAPFHATNLLLHAGVTLLVFTLARQLFHRVRVATIAAALFAVHPIHSEAVTSLVGRAEVQAALFALLALWSAARADVTRRHAPRLGWQAVSIASFSLAVLSKESALTLLLLIPLFRIACRDESWWQGLQSELRSLDWVPYALCAAFFLFLRFSVVGTVSALLPIKPLNNMLAFVPWPVRLRSALGVLWDYCGLLHLPLVLSADYSYDQVPLATSWLEARVLAGALLVIGATVFFIRHPHPGVRFAVALPLVALLLTANVLFPIGTIKAERLLYLPSVGWVLLAAYVGDRLWSTLRYRALAVVGIPLLVLAFAARTWARNWDWHDDMSLYRSEARSAPDSAKARHNLAVVYQREGNHAAAIAQFQRALAVYPYTESAFGIGLSYAQQDRLDEAIEWYQRALAITPDFSKAHTNLCYLLWSAKRFAAAANACRNGLRYAPADANLLKLLGLSLVGMGITEEGTEVLSRSLAVGGPDDELRTYLTRLESAAPQRRNPGLAPSRAYTIGRGDDAVE